MRLVALLSAAIRRGLIEASPLASRPCCPAGYPRRFAAALLKLDRQPGGGLDAGGYPRRFAAALLKQGDGDGCASEHDALSAAIRRGLIEAGRCSPNRQAQCGLSAAIRRGLIEASGAQQPSLSGERGYPRRFAAALLKQLCCCCCQSKSYQVIRGDSPRPY